MSATAQSEELFQVQLGSLVEAGARVQTAVGKVLHWGLSAVDVPTGESNHDCLMRELDELQVAIRRIKKSLVPTQLSLKALTNSQASEVTAVGVAPAYAR